MILVAGNAALLDFLAVADRTPGASEVASLVDGPGMQGRFVYGGAALVAALRLARAGHAVRLWHPLPDDPRVAAMLDELREACVDLDYCPRVEGALPVCVLIGSEAGRLAWSGRLEAPPIKRSDELLDGVREILFAPVWGAWARDLIDAARGRGIACSFFGDAAPDLPGQPWDKFIADERQYEAGAPPQARITCITMGSRGAKVLGEGGEVFVPAVAAQVVDTTGAGDAFAAEFVGALNDGAAVEEAAAHATARAAEVCEYWGGWPRERKANIEMKAATDKSARVQGALAGTACGDAFGMPNSFLREPVWRKAMEEGPANSPYHAGYPAGRITDDTEQALALTLALEDGFTRENVAKRLNEWFISVGGSQSLAVGPSTKRALEAFARGESVDTIGATGVTNGAAMRIAPVGVMAGLRGLNLAATAKLVETACWPTHATSPAISGALAAAWPIAVAVNGAAWEEVLDASIEGALFGETMGHWVYAPDIAERIILARTIARGCTSPEELAHKISAVIGAGEPCTETMPAAIAIAAFAKGDPALTIEIGGNLRGDTDTIAAIAGAICGAYAGIEALPAGWVELVEDVNPVRFDTWSARLERLIDKVEVPSSF